MPLNKSAGEYFDGLRRTYRRLQHEVTKDDVHHFVADAWHLIENIEKDSTSTKPQRAAAGRLRTDELIQICSMLCNEENIGTRKLVSSASFRRIGLSAEVTESGDTERALSALANNQLYWNAQTGGV